MLIHETRPPIMKRHIANFSLMAAIAFGVAVSPAAAQNRPAEGRQPDPAQRIERQVERLDEKLNLTDAQEQQIRQALEEHAREMREHLEAARNNKARPDREYLRTQREEMDRAIIAALTPEQQEQYKALKAERPNRGDRNKDRVRNRQRGDRAERMGQGIERFAKELNLTDAQQEQIKQLYKEQHEAVRSWMESNPNASREDRQAYMAERMKEGTARLESILNEEQMEKLRALREEMQQKWAEHRKQRAERRGERTNGGARPQGR